MEHAKKISGALWKRFKDFEGTGKTSSDWEAYMAGCNEVVNQYEYGSPERKLAMQMALAFINYTEQKEKERKEYNTQHGRK